MRRVGILLPAAADDPAWQARVGAFLQGLGQLGWSIGRNACHSGFTQSRVNDRGLGNAAASSSALRCMQQRSQLQPLATSSAFLLDGFFLGAFLLGVVLFFLALFLVADGDGW